MTEEKKQLQKQQKPAQKQDGGGLFHMHVRRFLSEVASAGQAVLKEAQHVHEDNNCKAPKVGASSNANKQPTESATKQVKPAPQPADRKVPEKSIPPKHPALRLVTPTAVLEMPKEVIGTPVLVVPENDWELLSTEEGASRTSNGSFVACPRAGSVRSITSIDHESSSHTELSLPFKIQRTNSSSTLDSQDNAIGPSGKGVLGVDYVEHVVLPTDTLQGICIAYKVSATHLRRANHFSGTLHSAPKKLVIPLSKQALRTGFIRVQDTDTKEYKLHYFQVEFPDINATAAKAYLELADWELKEAIQAAKEDREWETESDEGNEGDNGQFREKKEKDLKSGQIGIKVIDFRGGIPIFNLKGTGFPSLPKLKKNLKQSGSDDGSSGGNSGCSSTEECVERKEKVKIHKRPPAIATKSVLPQDLYNAAPQHEAFGFELQEIQKR